MVKKQSINLPKDWWDLSPLERMKKLQETQSKLDVIRTRLTRDKRMNLKLSLLKEEMTRHLI